MVLNILKKDIKRKKTMNIILLIFIILASTFISSSVNNLVKISSTLDSYLEKAGVSDYFIAINENLKTESELENFLDSNENVTDYKKNDLLLIPTECFKINENQKFEINNTPMINPYNTNQQKFFDIDNKEITHMNDGEIYLPLVLMNSNNLRPGDKISITKNNLTMEFTLLGNVKDALLGSSMMGSKRMLISENDYQKLKAGSNFSITDFYSITSSDTAKLGKDFNNSGLSFVFSCDKEELKTFYVMDMVIASILLIVSICLIIISLTILRFTIIFTLNEEFKEIGIMKAIGIKEGKIRSIYIIKYLAISIVGSLIGFILSIPFGQMFIKEVSQNIVISSDKNNYILNILCSLSVVIITVSFCYFCSRQVNKFSAIQAIRNGSNGERFKKKSIFKLSKSKLPTILFISINDIFSNIKRFVVLIIIFTIGITLIIIPINTINTLTSDHIVKWFSLSESDMYLNNDNFYKDYTSKDGQDKLQEYLDELTQKFKDNNMDVKVAANFLFKFRITHGDNGCSSLAFHSLGTTTDQYDYIEGVAPKYKNEVAITHIISENIGAKIGDTVKIKVGDEEREYIITAIFQSMTNMGEGIRFSEKENLDYSYTNGSFAFQVYFNNQLSSNEKTEYFDKAKDLFPNFDVYKGGEYINKMMGDISSQLDGVKQLIVIVIICINMLVSILMIRTFITKEKGEIGMLKSIGFSNSSIISWQILRIGIILIISTIIGAIISNPLSKISSGQVFKMMGATNIEFVINPLEVYIMYPAIILVCTLFASFIAALQIKRISAHETNNIE